MKKLIFLALLTTLSTNAFAENESKQFLSFSLGSSKNKAGVRNNEDPFEYENLKNVSTFSIEAGKYNVKKLDENLNFGIGVEFSRHETKHSDNETDDNVRVPIFGYNFYLSSNYDKFMPYFGIGLTMAPAKSIKVKIIDKQPNPGDLENYTLTNSLASVGYQIKLGGNYKLDEKLFLGLEYKLVNINPTLDTVQYDGSDILLPKDNEIDMRNRINSFQIKIGAEF